MLVIAVAYLPRFLALAKYEICLISLIVLLSDSSRLNILVSKFLFIEISIITITILLYIVRLNVRAALSYLISIWTFANIFVIDFSYLSGLLIFK